MEVCWVQDKSVVSQGTRQCAVFAVSCDMGEILQHFSKDMSAVYFWPLSTAQGDPRGWIANCFHTVIRAPSCRNMLQSFFPPSPVQLGLTRIFRFESITRTAAKWRRAITELIWQEAQRLLAVRLHHYPIIRSLLCPHFLSNSWLAKSPMTLCCDAAV